MHNIDKDKLLVLSNKKIYFGHQSVGYNIIDGLKIVLDASPEYQLNIKETDKPSDYTGGIFGHSTIGRNTAPESKIDDFVSIIDGGIGNVADVVFFKLCYVDINERTDVEKLFAYYQKQMNYLEKKYTDIKFLHFTVPLQTNDRIPLGIRQKCKHIVKTVLGMDTGKNENLKDNVMRNRFNELMKKKYTHILDLAAIESTDQSGNDCLFVHDGKYYRQLCKEYTYDGGHLNEKAKEIISVQIINKVITYIQ